MQDKFAKFEEAKQNNQNKQKNIFQEIQSILSNIKQLRQDNQSQQARNNIQNDKNVNAGNNNIQALKEFYENELKQIKEKIVQEQKKNRINLQKLQEGDQGEEKLQQKSEKLNETIDNLDQNMQKFGDNQKIFNNYYKIKDQKEVIKKIQMDLKNQQKNFEKQLEKRSKSFRFSQKNLADIQRNIDDKLSELNQLQTFIKEVSLDPFNSLNALKEKSQRYVSAPNHCFDYHIIAHLNQDIFETQGYTDANNMLNEIIFVPQIGNRPKYLASSDLKQENPKKNHSKQNSQLNKQKQPIQSDFNNYNNSYKNNNNIPNNNLSINNNNTSLNNNVISNRNINMKSNTNKNTYSNLNNINNNMSINKINFVDPNQIVENSNNYEQTNIQSANNNAQINNSIQNYNYSITNSQINPSQQQQSIFQEIMQSSTPSQIPEQQSIIKSQRNFIQRNLTKTPISQCVQRLQSIDTSKTIKLFSNNNTQNIQQNIALQSSQNNNNDNITSSSSQSSQSQNQQNENQIIYLPYINSNNIITHGSCQDDNLYIQTETDTDQISNNENNTKNIPGMLLEDALMFNQINGYQVKHNISKHLLNQISPPPNKRRSIDTMKAIQQIDLKVVDDIIENRSLNNNIYRTSENYKKNSYDEYSSQQGFIPHMGGVSVNFNNSQNQNIYQTDREQINLDSQKRRRMNRSLNLGRVQRQSNSSQSKDQCSPPYISNSQTNRVESLEQHARDMKQLCHLYATENIRQFNDNKVGKSLLNKLMNPLDNQSSLLTLGQQKDQKNTQTNKRIEQSRYQILKMNQNDFFNLLSRLTHSVQG